MRPSGRGAASPSAGAIICAGSDRGERAAAMYSLIENAKLNGIDPEAHLRDILVRIADHPVNHIADLLSWH